MTDMKPTADKVMKEFYRSCLGKEPTFKDDKIAVSASLKEVITQLGYDNYNVDGDHGLAVVNVRDILKVCEELENVNGSDVIVLWDELENV
jgi:hypothetical protein